MVLLWIDLFLNPGLAAGLPSAGKTPVFQAALTPGTISTLAGPAGRLHGAVSSLQRRGFAAAKNRPCISCRFDQHRSFSGTILRDGNGPGFGRRYPSRGAADVDPAAASCLGSGRAFYVQ